MPSTIPSSASSDLVFGMYVGGSVQLSFPVVIFVRTKYSSVYALLMISTPLHNNFGVRVCCRINGDYVCADVLAIKSFNCLFFSAEMYSEGILIEVELN